MSEEKQHHTLSVVGAGFNGSGIVYHFAKTLLKHRSFTQSHSFHIRLFDKSGRFFSGEPYNPDCSSLYTLNQPTCFMSIDHNQPDLCTHDLGCHGHAFVSRNRYGKEHIEKQVKGALAATAEAGVALTFECINDHVTHFDKDPATGLFHLSCRSGAHFLSDKLILPEGHQPNLTFEKLHDHPLYLRGHCDPKHLDTVLSYKRHQAVGIIGGVSPAGQDWQVLLDHIGYSGRQCMIAKSDPEFDAPWPFYPELYQQKKPAYALHFATPDYFEQNPDKRHHQGLRDALLNEFQTATDQGYGTSHVLWAAHNGLPDLAVSGLIDPVDLEKFHADLIRKRSRPTPPEKYDLYKKYKDNGLIQFVYGHLEPEQIESCGDGFALYGLCPDNQPLYVDALLDAAPYDRHRLPPLVQNGIDIGSVQLDANGRVKPGRQKDRDLYINIPQSYEIWGVETFRQENETIAQNIFCQALGLIT